MVKHVKHVKRLGVVCADVYVHDACMQVLSFNELGMDSLMKPKKQVVVMVVSSTGEGDPPDNSARFYGHSK